VHPYASIILLLLIVNACQQTRTSDFFGSWYFCDYTGAYTELHIINEQTAYLQAVDFCERRIDIRNDTLTTFDTLENWVDEHGSPSIIEYHGTINNGTLNWLIRDGDSVKYHRIYERMPNRLSELKISKDSLLNFLNDEFHNRKVNRNCQDQRTKEERTLDSLESEELIQEIL
jgi:hypothetical protein